MLVSSVVHPLISVIIRNRNEAQYLPLVLESLQQQRHVRIEIILVDNESEDDSVEIGKKYGCRIVTLRKDNFSYGRGINVGMGVASAEICVLLSAHSMLVGPYSLKSCVDAFEDPTIGATRFVNVDKLFDIKRWISPDTLSGPPDVGIVVSKGPLANGCAVRRSVWEKVPFDESLPAAEEKIWAIELLRRGYRICSPAPVAYSYLKTIPLASRIRKNNVELLAIHASTGVRLSHLREGIPKKIRKFAYNFAAAPVLAFRSAYVQTILELKAYFSARHN